MTARDVLEQLTARVDFVLVNVPSFDAANADRPIRALDLRLAELTAEFITATFGVPLAALHFADSYDAALAAGTRDFCLIQRFGHLFHGPQDAVAGALLDALDACSFLTGHIMERGGYYYFHDQCVLVNRRAWERLGRPAFGTPASGPQTAAVPRRSAADVHDDYTPVFLDPTGEEKVWDGAFGYGWQAISESLRHGLRVTNWGDAPRRFKRNCYAYYGHPEEWQRALVDVPAAPATSDDGLQGILDVLNGASARGPASDAAPFQGAFMLDVPQVRFRDGLDSVLAPAGGFAIHRVLTQMGFHDRTVLTFYATHAEQLAPQREVFERWDGRDPAALTVLMGASPDSAPALATRFGQFVRATFGAVENWTAHWDRVRRLPVHYVPADPVADPQGFGALGAADDATVAVLLGTCFNDFAAIARFDGARRRKAYDIVIAAQKRCAARYIILGQPPYVRIRGI